MMMISIPMKIDIPAVSNMGMNVVMWIRIIFNVPYRQGKRSDEIVWKCVFYDTTVRRFPLDLSVFSCLLHCKLWYEIIDHLSMSIKDGI